MRKILFIFVLGMLLVGSVRADVQETFTIGREWAHQMSPREKFMSLLPPTYLFSAYDVHLRHSLPNYIHWIDSILQHNPQLEDEDVTNLFASTIFLFEPENRDAIKAMEANFLRGDYGRSRPPKLHIEQAASQ